MVTKANPEKGMILLLTLIAMVGGILIIGPLMTYISTNLYSLQKGDEANTFKNVGQQGCQRGQDTDKRTIGWC